MIRRCIKEAQVGGQLQHPGILPVYELGLARIRSELMRLRDVGLSLALSLIAFSGGSLEVSPPPDAR
jgi:hypothetical protein